MIAAKESARAYVGLSPFCFFRAWTDYGGYSRIKTESQAMNREWLGR
jgi:hypothetical protein